MYTETRQVLQNFKISELSFVTNYIIHETSRNDKWTSALNILAMYLTVAMQEYRNTVMLD